MSKEVTQKEVTQPETIKIDEVDYLVSSLTEGALKILQDMSIVNEKLKETEVTFNIFRLAKDALYAKLIVDIDKFEKAPEKV